jgi:glycosyltransferase involved in cell wall biosynthesis
MLSVIVPLLNEKDSLQELVARILEVEAAMGHPGIEIWLIDDGSSDGSWETIESLAHEHGSVRGIRFRRNFGKAAALAAGFSKAQGDVIISLDADLQDDPKEIPRLLQKLSEGFDVVSGWKQTRHDPWHKRWPSRIFNMLLRSFTGLALHDFNCGFKAYRKTVVEEIDLYGEMHRFIPVLAAARGFRVAELAVQHHARLHGFSKYGLSRIPKGFMDLLTVFFLTRFRYRPQHLLGGIGGAVGTVGLLMLTGLILSWLWSRIAQHEAPMQLHEGALFYISILMVMVGVQLLSLGLLAELVVAHSLFRRPSYSIADQTQSKSSSPPYGA